MVQGKEKCIEAFLEARKRACRRAGILDIGSGFGSMVPLLRRLGIVDALEVNAETIPQLERRGVRNVYCCKTFPDELPSKRYDIVTMFDVLEHIRDDEKAVRVIHDKLLTDKGLLIVTVPAYQWLWSSHDTKSHHFRRYNRSKLSDLFCRSGFKGLHVSYFMSLLFPIAVLQRITEKVNPGLDSVKVPRFVNALLYSLFSSESMLIRKGPLPFGLSLALIGRRN